MDDLNKNEATNNLLTEQFLKGVYQPPSALSENDRENLFLIRVLTDHETTLNILKQELRGEQLYESETGEKYWVQVDKPMFVKLDKENKPSKKFNEKTKRMEYQVNDDAINMIINIIKSCGLNQITPMTVLDENNIRADLLEAQSKVVALLFIKRKEWGIDKAEYPIICTNINTMIQDARYRAKEGIGLKAVRTVTSRIEQSSDQQRMKTMGERIKSPFS